MGKPQRRKRHHQGDKPIKEKYRTKRKTKDFDEIQKDLKPGNVEKLLTQTPDEDLPGLGQHYCVHCGQHFVTDRAIQDHFRGKPHKKRVRALKTTAWTHEDADRAAGMGSYKPAKPFNVELPATFTSISTDTVPTAVMQVDGDKTSASLPTDT